MKQKLLAEKEVSSFCEEAKRTIQKYLPAEEFDSIRFDKGQALYHQGNYPDGLYILVSGKVKICMKGDGGKEQILRIGIKNDYLGFECLLKYSRYCSAAIALTKIETVFVPKEFFNYLIQAKPELLKAFAELLSSNLLEREQKLTDTSYKPVRGRLADALLLLDKQFNADTEEAITLTRTELASYIGSVRETTTRMLSEFKTDEIIEVIGDSIYVSNREKLFAISNLYN